VPSYAYDYYKVEVPSDEESNPGERAQLAILRAFERARLWPVPCEWYIVSDTGELVTVRRRRLRPVRLTSMSERLEELIFRFRHKLPRTDEGYNLIYYTKQGLCLCHRCATKDLFSPDPVDNVYDYEVYWEGPDEECEVCHRKIESAYGDPHAEKKEAA
jgi:hypothetical protein